MYDMKEYEIFDEDKLLIHRHTAVISNSHDIKSYVFKTLRIIHVIAGVADWLIGSKIYTIKEDDIVILNNIEVRQFIMNKHNNISINIYEFLPSSYYYNFECQNIFYNRGYNFKNVLYNDNPHQYVLLDLLKKIDHEIINQPPVCKAMISALLITFLVNATRIMNESSPDSVILTNVNHSSEYAASIAHAASYINNNLNSELNIDILARISNMSRSYFSKMFKKYIGIGVVDYINMCRLNNVNRIRKNTDCTIIEAAFDSGYKTSSNFYRALKKYSKLKL